MIAAGVVRLIKGTIVTLMAQRGHGGRSIDIMRFRGKTVVLFGGGSGIGEASAKMFAEEGANVVVSGIPADECARVVGDIVEAGGQAVSLPADVAREDQVREVFAEIAAKLGHIDVVYTGAGIVADAAITDMSEDEWDRVLDINLKGIFLTCKHAALTMGDGGAIITVSSIAGLVGQRRRTAYCASKAGIIGLTRALAVELADRNIRVTAVCPGATETPFFRQAYAGYEDADRMRREQIAKHPLGRLSTPEDIAHAVLFLTSDEARSVTGALLTVDGGFTAI